VWEGFARDVGGEKEGGFGSMLGVARRQQRWTQSGQSQIAGGFKSFVFLAKRKLRYEACADAFRLTTTKGLKSNHLTILFGVERKPYDTTLLNRNSQSDWKAFV
jgi:hypothetical protein